LLAQFANFLSQSERRLTDREVQTALREEFLTLSYRDVENRIYNHTVCRMIAGKLVTSERDGYHPPS
jgi:hypothetical protein